MIAHLSRYVKGNLLLRISHRPPSVETSIYRVSECDSNVFAID